MTIGTTVLGYPRIGPNRELKKAVEGYWANRIDAARLQEVAATLRADTWRSLRQAGLDSIPSNTFSFYDQVLDTSVMVGAIPEIYGWNGGAVCDSCRRQRTRVSWHQK